MDITNKLWMYNNWANRELIGHLEDSLLKVPMPTMHLLSHIVNTQLIWLDRIRGIQPKIGVWDDHAMDICKSMHQQASVAFQQEIVKRAHLPYQIIRYNNTKGIQFETTFQDIMLHVFNHSTYHRAQIAQNLRQMGLEPINTDYITFARS